MNSQPQSHETLSQVELSKSCLLGKLWKSQIQGLLFNRILHWTGMMWFMFDSCLCLCYDDFVNKQGEHAYHQVDQSKYHPALPRKWLLHVNDQCMVSCCCLRTTSSLHLSQSPLTTLDTWRTQDPLVMLKGPSPYSLRPQNCSSFYLQILCCANNSTQWLVEMAASKRGT